MTLAQNISTIILLCLMQLSCAKEYGCTDDDALNYNAAAELEDNSCTYDKKLYLSWGPISQILWGSADYTYLEVFINNNPEDTIIQSEFSANFKFVNTIIYDLPQITRIQVLANDNTEIHDGVYVINNPVSTSALQISD